MMARAATKHSAVPSHSECSEITEVKPFDLGDCAARCGRGVQRADIAASSVKLGGRDQAPVKKAVIKTAKEPRDRETCGQRQFGRPPRIAQAFALAVSIKTGPASFVSFV